MVGVDLTSFRGKVDCTGEDLVGVETSADDGVWFLGGWRKDRSGLGGLDVLALLIQVAHVGLNAAREMARDVGGSERGPGSEISVANSW